MFTTVPSRSWRLPLWWKNQLSLWKQRAVCISSRQWWAQVQNATILSGTSVTYLCGWLAWSLLCTKSIVILWCFMASRCGCLWLFLYDRFQWSIAEPDQEFIFVQPNHGELHPNDSSVRNKCNYKSSIQRTLNSSAYHLFRSRCGHSAHGKKKNTHLHLNSPFGQHTLLDVTTQNSALKWWEWAPKGLYW